MSHAVTRKNPLETSQCTMLGRRFSPIDLL
jgi:hypothetical protein